MRWRRWRLITNLLRPMKCTNWLLLAGNASRRCEFQFRQSPMIYNIMARVWLMRAYSRDYSRVHAAWCVCGIGYMRTVTRLRPQDTTSISKMRTVYSTLGLRRRNVVCARARRGRRIIPSGTILSMPNVYMRRRKKVACIKSLWSVIVKFLLIWQFWSFSSKSLSYASSFIFINIFYSLFYKICFDWLYRLH